MCRADQIFVSERFENRSASCLLTDIEVKMAREPTFLMQPKHGFFEIAHHQHPIED
jgi:hypothetical protein